MKPAQYTKKWRWMAPLGLTLIGAGLSLTGEATLLKGAQVAAWQWIAMGTTGLVLLNAGVSVFGDAVKRRFWDEWRENQERP